MMENKDKNKDDEDQDEGDEEEEKLNYHEARGWFEEASGGGDASRSTVEKLLPA